MEINGKELKRMTNKLSEVETYYGMNIDFEKIKVMRISKKERKH